MRKASFRFLTTMTKSSNLVRQYSLNIQQRCYDLKNEVDNYLEILKHQKNVDAIKSLKNKLEILWTYHTVALRGTSTLQFDDVRRLLKDNLTTANSNYYEQLDVKNHSLAIQYSYILSKFHLTGRSMYSFTLEPEDDKLFFEIDSTFILLLYSGYYGRIDINDSYYSRPGTYKYMDCIKDLEHLNKGRDLFTMALKKDDNAFEIAAKIHQEIEAAYPKDRHRGIISRLNMNLSLMVQGFFPVIIQVEQKYEYQAAIKASDENNNCAPLTDFILQCMINTYELYVIPDLKKSLGQTESTVMKLT